MTTKTGKKNGNGNKRITKAKQEASKTLRTDKLAAFYAKYPHVVKGSVREPTAEDKKALAHVHGLVCDVKCTHRGCSETRPVNLQDVFQVKFCNPHRREAQLARKNAKKEARAARRTAKKAAKASKKVETAPVTPPPAPKTETTPTATA